VTDQLRCPRCGHTIFEVRITASSVDLDVDVADQDQFYLNELVVAEPESIDVEAVCGKCAHVRFVPDDQWDWA
jgi:hypothetical protein